MLRDFIQLLDWHYSKHPELIYHQKSNGGLDLALDRSRAFANFVRDIAFAGVSPKGACHPTERFFVIKVDVNRDGMNRLASIYGQARYVAIVRNGIEAVGSMALWPGFDHLSFERICEVWADRDHSISNIGPNILTTTLRHEDFHLRPVAAFGLALKELGLPAERRIGNYARRTLINQEPSGSTRTVRTAGEVWRSWNVKKQRAFRRTCGDRMQSLGYEIPQ